MRIHLLRNMLLWFFKRFDIIFEKLLLHIQTLFAFNLHKLSFSLSTWTYIVCSTYTISGCWYICFFSHFSIIFFHSLILWPHIYYPFVSICQLLMYLWVLYNWFKYQRLSGGNQWKERNQRKKPTAIHWKNWWFYFAMNRWYNLTFFLNFSWVRCFLTEKVFQETMENWADFEKKEKVLEALEAKKS